MRSTFSTLCLFSRQNCRQRQRHLTWRTLVFTIILILNQLAPYGIESTLLDTSVACDQSNFLLTLNFDGPFRGLVYSEDDFPNCVYVNGTMLSRSAYQLKIPLAGCETRVNEDGNYENAIIVQESDAFLQATDKKYLLTCIPTAPVSVVPARPTTTVAAPIVITTTTRTTAATLAIRTVPPVVFDERRATQLPQPTTELNSDEMITVGIGGGSSSAVVPPASRDTSLKYSVEIRNGHTLDAPPLRAALNIGDPISYMVRLQKPVADSQVGRCWASDSRSSLELSDERGCSLQPRAHIWGAFERAETDREVVFVNRIKAWAFPTSNEVNIFCNLRICMSRVCSFGNCTGRLTADKSENAVTVSERQKFHDDNFTEENDADMLPRRPRLQLPRDDASWRGRQRRHGDTTLLVPAKTFSAATFNENGALSLIGMAPLMSRGDPSAVHIGGRVGELTEVETLATHLRFRRQSLQRARHSDTNHLIIAEDRSDEVADEVTPTLRQRHRDPPPQPPSPIRQGEELEGSRAQLREIDDFRTAAVPPVVTPSPPHGAFAPTAWRVAAVVAFLALFAAALATFFWLWRDGAPNRERR